MSQRFCDINLQVLNRRNRMPFMTKQLSKEIMKRSRLPNNFLRNKTEERKFFIIDKGITVYLFCENLRENTMKT